jgi:hypothetical protein
MWRFCEKFMEDCVHAAPAAFAGEDLKIVSRQVRLNGFVPDLILTDSEGRVVILEIQMNALDRYHLYKSLEYRDLWALQEPGMVPRVILLCETMDGRFEPLIRTHGIELLQIDRGKFIRTAIQHTPSTVAASLANGAVASAEERESSAGKPKLEFIPFDWGYRTNPSDVIAYLSKEFGRLGIDIDELPRRYYGTIYWDVCNFLDEELERSLKTLWTPGAWKHELLKQRGSKELGWSPYEKISKPRIAICPYITQKGNLSVTWEPSDSESLDSEWAWWPSGASYGWDRPNNEILFLREVGHLNPRIHLSEWDDRVNYDVLDGIFVAIIKTCFDHLVRLLRVAFEVELINDIELDLVEICDQKADKFGRTHVVGWRIFNVEARTRRNSDIWISNFAAEYGFSLDRFASECRSISFSSKSKNVNLDRGVSNNLKRDGFKITEGKVREIRERLLKHHDYGIRDLVRKI